MSPFAGAFPLKGDFFALLEIKVVLISLAHGVNDMYAAFLPTFVPYIKASLRFPHPSGLARKTRGDPAVRFELIYYSTPENYLKRKENR